MALNKAFSCAPCKCRGTSVSAVKYCTSCQEQLCKDCVEFHKAFKATRKHILVHSEDQQPQKMRQDLEMFQTCTKHLNKQTDFYCGYHGVLLCSLCLLNHKNCDDIVDIDTAGKSFLDTHFTDIVKVNYQKMTESARSTITNMKKAKKSTRDDLEILMKQIENIRRKMTEAFDRQTNHIIHEVSKDLVDNSGKCEKACQDLENLVELAAGSENLFQSVIDTGSPQDVFRCVLSILGQCEDFQKEVEQTKSQCSRLKVAVEKSDVVKMLETSHGPLLSCSVNKTAFDIPSLCSEQLNKDFLSHMSAQTVHLIPKRTITKGRAEKGKNDGAETNEFKDKDDRHGSLKPVKTVHELAKSSSDLELETDHAESDVPRLQSKKPDLGRQIEDIDVELSHCDSFDVQTSDNKIPWFNGIVCLPDERLILSDYNNSRLVMVRSRTDVKEKGIEYRPGKITLFNGFLVVCLKETNQLLLLKIEENNLKEHKYLQIEHHPRCVKTVDEDRFLVSSKSRKGDWHFELITSQGQKWKRTKLNIKLTGIYDGYVFAIQHLPGTQGKFHIIQSSDEPGRLQCFHQDGGSALFQYEVDDTTSLETDSNGHIFVVRYPGEVQVLTPEGSLITSIQRLALKRLKFAALNEAEDKLFITTVKDSRIHVLDVKRLHIIK